MEQWLTHSDRLSAATEALRTYAEDVRASGDAEAADVIDSIGLAVNSTVLDAFKRALSPADAATLTPEEPEVKS